MMIVTLLAISLLAATTLYTVIVVFMKIEDCIRRGVWKGSLAVASQFCSGLIA